MNIINLIFEVVTVKLNRFLIASILILAILTVGAVCASDNITQDAVTLKSDDSSPEDLLGGESYYDDDFYITVCENYSQDKKDWDSKELIYISSHSNENGTFSVFVGDVLKESLTLTDGYFSKQDAYNKYFADIYPTDLGLDIGKYNVKVKFNGNTLINSQVSLSQKEDFDIFMQNPYYCEQEYWSSPSFIVIDSNHFNTGTLEILVNGNRKISYAVNNGSFEEIADCSNKSRYLSASDLVEGYGTYNIKITFTENGMTKTLKDENVVIGEFEPTVDPKIEMYFDLYTVNIPADDIAHIYLPREATGILTISYNNVNESISYSKGYATHYMHSWNLNHLGENKVTATYVGDDFGTLTVTESIIVVPGIVAPSYVNVGEEFAITMCTHEWVIGNFNVYEYNDGKKGKLLASNEIRNRYSTVKLSSDFEGLNRYYLEFDYPGGDYPVIQDVYMVKNSENVNVEISSEAEVGKAFNVSITAPAIDFTFAQISVDDGEVEFLNMGSGKAIKSISSLDAGYHTVKVFYDNGYHWDGAEYGDIYLNTFTVNVGVKTEIIYEVVKFEDSSQNLVIGLVDINGNVLANRDILVKLAGLNLTLTTDSEGIAVLPINLAAGNYKADIYFTGEKGYLSSSNTANITVDKTKTFLLSRNIKMSYGEDKNLTVNLFDIAGNDMAGKEIIINFTNLNVTYKKITDINGQVILPIDLKADDYDVYISFLGDDSYLPSFSYVNVDISKARTYFASSSLTCDFKHADIEVTLSTDYGIGVSNKNIVFDWDSSQTTGTTDKSGKVNFSMDITKSNFTMSIYFEGDENFMNATGYLAVIFKDIPTALTVPAVTTTYNVAKDLVITLKDTWGNALDGKNIVIKLNGKNYSKKTDGNGQVRLSVNLPAKTYVAEISFAGDDAYKAVSKSVNVVVNKATPKLTASAKTFKANVKTKKVTATLKSNTNQVIKNAKVTLKVNGKTYSAKTNSKGVATFTVKLTKKGTFKAIYKYAGNSNYKAVSKTVNIKIN